MARTMGGKGGSCLLPCPPLLQASRYNAASFYSHPGRQKTPLPARPPRKAILELLFFFPFSSFFNFFFFKKTTHLPPSGLRAGCQNLSTECSTLAFYKRLKTQSFLPRCRDASRQTLRPPAKLPSPPPGPSSAHPKEQPEAARA